MTQAHSQGLESNDPCLIETSGSKRSGYSLDPTREAVCRPCKNLPRRNVTEQSALEIAWSLLVTDFSTDLRRAIYTN
eukprot:scaffold5237_cov179-Amphora_coffeaeformis.AAC.13